MPFTSDECSAMNPRWGYLRYCRSGQSRFAKQSLIISSDHTHCIPDLIFWLNYLSLHGLQVAYYYHCRIVFYCILEDPEGAGGAH